MWTYTKTRDEYIHFCYGRVLMIICLCWCISFFAPTRLHFALTVNKVRRDVEGLKERTNVLFAIVISMSTVYSVVSPSPCGESHQIEPLTKESPWKTLITRVVGYYSWEWISAWTLDPIKMTRELLVGDDNHQP